jgi:hypothetical protein
MPNINFSAPVIRLGTTAQPKSDLLSGRDDRSGRRPGLGSGLGSERGQDRGGLVPIQPQTKEEIIKTIFVGGITEGTGGDEGVERILRAAGNLRRWIRATDADDKPCKFGFAEYEDPESLSTAIEVLKEVEVPVKRQTPGESKSDGEEAIETSQLLVRFYLYHALNELLTGLTDCCRRELRRLHSTMGRQFWRLRPRCQRNATRPCSRRPERCTEGLGTSYCPDTAG